MNYGGISSGATIQEAVGSSTAPDILSPAPTASASVNRGGYVGTAVSDTLAV